VKAGVEQSRVGPAEILSHLGERVQGPLALALPAGPRRVRLGVAQHERLGHGDASRRGESSEDAFHHCPSEKARSSAAGISAVEVAPGSGWPMLRSPRYEARPLEACSGTVARAPSSAAARAAATAEVSEPPPSSASRSARTAGASASTIVLSPSCAAPSSTTPSSAASSAASRSAP